VTGESYGGKYVPAMAYAIHKNNPSADLKVNLKGISIGNGLVDPVNMFKYSDYLYQIGLLDRNGRSLFKSSEAEAEKLIGEGKYLEAFRCFDALLNGDLIPYKSTFYNVTKFNFYFNYLHSEDDSPYGDMNKYLAKDLVRRSIHVGNLTFNSGVKVEEHLAGDVMRSVAPWLQVLMDNYRVLIYNGQLDIIVAYPLTVSYLNLLEWSGASLYKTAPRQPWYVGTDLAGFSKTVGNFTEVLVRNAGHMVPQDQPVWALDLITKFTNNIPLDNTPR
jgi:vitellogenic carboxypeptidase-like protein